jgi:hypothetical protein
MSPRAINDIDGFRFYFFSNENNEPPHVHIEKGGGAAKWWLTPEPSAVYSVGFKASDERRIKTLVKEHQHELRKAWDKYFG